MAVSGGSGDGSCKCVVIKVGGETEVRCVCGGEVGGLALFQLELEKQISIFSCLMSEL